MKLLGTLLRSFLMTNPQLSMKRKKIFLLKILTKNLLIVLQRRLKKALESCVRFVSQSTQKVTSSPSSVHIASA